MSSLPFIPSSYQADMPDGEIGEYAPELDLNELVVRHPAATFFMRVATPTHGLHPGDLAVVDRATTPGSGSLLVGERDGQLVVCRPGKSGPPLTVWGVITYVVRRVGGEP